LAGAYDRFEPGTLVRVGLRSDDDLLYSGKVQRAGVCKQLFKGDECVFSEHFLKFQDTIDIVWSRDGRSEPHVFREVPDIYLRVPCRVFGQENIGVLRGLLTGNEYPLNPF
jgi:hypothetical protein